MVCLSVGTCSRARRGRYVSQSKIDKKAASIIEVTELSECRLSEGEFTNHFAAVAVKAKSWIRGTPVNRRKGFRLPIALEGLIEEVVLSPDAGLGYLQEVRSFVDEGWFG